jgi:hypothetical protein
VAKNKIYPKHFDCVSPEIHLAREEMEFRGLGRITEYREDFQRGPCLILQRGCMFCLEEKIFLKNFVP